LGRSIGTLVTVLLVFAIEAGGQSLVTGADLRGTVRDATGMVVPDATVAAVSLDTGVSRITRTDSEGRYTIAALPPGRYRASATAMPLGSRVRDEIALLLGQVVLVDFVLLPTIREQIIVEPLTPVMEVDRTGVSSVIVRHQIEDLPINGRNFMSFAALTPGVALTEQARPGAETSGLSFTGQRPDANNLMVDGADHNDRILGGALASVGQEAVREFQVLTNAYSAEFGQATGGVINIVTRSGSNARRGELFLFHRNEHLNARDHFEHVDIFGMPLERTKAPYRQYQWGGTLGGPVLRDRTFYFLSFERLDIQASNFVNIEPAAAFVLNAAGFPVELGHVPYTIDTTQFSGKLAHQWTAARSLNVAGHFSDVTNENFRPYGGLTARSHGVVQLRDDVALSATQSDVWGTGWVNEARAQIAHQRQHTRSLDPRCGGPCTGELQGGPEISIPGVAVIGRNIYEPTARTNWRLQLTNVLSRATGRHLLKAGASFISLDQETRTPLEFGGSFTFAPLPAIPELLLPVPLTALDAFAAGIPALYVRGFGNSSGPFTYKEVSAFAQDDWRATSHLTLKAGLRYQTQLWPALQTTVSNVAGTTLTYPFPQDRDNVAPRIAASYDLTGDGRTSLDGAYGLFYGNQLATILGSQIVFDGSPDGVRLMVLPFPLSVAAWQAPEHQLPEPAGAYPSSVITVAPGLESPYAHQSSIGVSHTFGNQLQMSASFVQVYGRRQIGSVNYNPLVPALGPGRRPNDVAGIPGTSAEVFQFTDFGVSSYRGLLVSVRRRLGIYDFLASYTLSKAEDNSSAFIGQVEHNGAGRHPADPDGLPLQFSPDREMGPADFDRRHRFVLSGSVRAPGEIQVAAIVAAASARPFTPLAGADMNGDGLPFADRARTDPLDPATSVGRNSERMNAEAQVDVRVSRRFALGSSVSVDVLFDAFNLFNRTNYLEINNVFGPGAFPGSPLRDNSGRVTYGRFEKAQAPRQLQLGARLRF
jgi:carboxypeptidase family protein/TonB-dependent receptor-like protein